MGSISVSADTFVSYDIKTQKKEVKNIEAEENSIKEMPQTNDLEKQNRSVIGEKVLFPVYENESKKRTDPVLSSSGRGRRAQSLCRL